MPNWKKLIVSGSDAALNSLNVTSEFTASGLNYPTTDGDNGDFLLTDGSGNLSFSRSTIFANVKNISGVTLQKGTPVHATGTSGNSSEVIAASASVASTMPATYVLNETLADDAEGLALITGYLNGVDTSAFGEGDIIYVGESGGYTNVKPQGFSKSIQNLGIVNKVDASNGSGYVYGSGRSNDVPNLPEGKVWVGSSTYSVTSSVAHLDETNERLGINTNTPGASLDVIGDISGSTTLTIGSGHSNTGTLSSIAGGTLNTGSGLCGFIGGGRSNVICSGAYGFIGGGLQSIVNTNYGVVVGGQANEALQTYSVTVGGYNNVDEGYRAFIGGGANNDITNNGTDSVLVGGLSNDVQDSCSFLGGGHGNIIVNSANGQGFMTIGGGQYNCTSCGGAAVAGGAQNDALGCLSFVGGGFQNVVSEAKYGVIAGGCQNEITGSDTDGARSFIGGGTLNYISSNYSVIGGGANNLANGLTSTIAGGYLNTSSAPYSFIGGGCSNSIASPTGFGVIAGGENGGDTGIHNFIGGGKNNYVASTSGSIVGGFNNNVAHANSHIIGSNITTDKVNYTFVNNLDVEGDAIIGDTLDVGGVVSVDSKINITQLTLTDAATVSWNLANGSNSKITLGGNRTLAISNVAVGDTGTILVKQGSGTTHTLTLPAGSLIIGGATYTTTTTSNGVDVLGFYYDGTNYFWSIPQTATTGAKGDKGEVGDTGDKGQKGEVGDTGDKGQKGEVGDTGDKGQKGEVGAASTVTGPTGDKGQKGEVGAASTVTGPTGDKGDKGAVGPSGVPSITGNQNNYVLTATGGTSINGESNLTFDGTTLTVEGKTTIGSGHLNTGTSSSIAGGTLNTASASCSFIGGGESNELRSGNGVLVGGSSNLVCANGNVTLVGGCCNIASGCCTFLGGGNRNKTEGQQSVLVGGTLNTGSGNCSFIGGGESNSVLATRSFIGGGESNCIDTLSDSNVITGGKLNYICGHANGFHSIGGGYGNCIDIGNTSCNAATIAGGSSNTILADCSFIGGGRLNTVIGSINNSSIVGGLENTASGACGFIGGGCSNYLTGVNSVIGGGDNNTLTDPGNSFLGGGLNNSLNSGGSRNVLVGGEGNCLTGLNQLAFLGGGKNNCIGGTSGDCYQFLGGGEGNYIPSTYSSIVGGFVNTASGNYSFIGGGQSNIAEGVHSYAGGLQSCTTGAQGFAHGYQACATGGASAAFGAVQEAIGENSFVAGGALNSACAQYSFVGGYNNETTTSAKASSVLGESNCVNAPWSFAVGSNNCILGGNVLAVAGGNIVGGKINKVQGTYSLGNLVMGNDNCIGDGSSSVGGAAAFGGGNCVLADGTVAIGINNNNPVSGQTGYGCNTLLLGCNNQAHFNQNSIVGGTDSDGYGCNSIAFGFGATTATGGQQYAFGTGTTNPNNGTTANIANSMVIGSYNVWSITDCHLFAVGNGVGDGSRTNALNVSSNGRTGLGCTSPQTRLDVNGTTRTTTLVETSARRYKENIVSLQDQLENIKKLEPVEFEWKETKKKDIGLIAEDVEKIYPQLVEHDDNGDVMGVKYSKITSLLVKAIQEQQEQIDQLKIEVKNLKQNK